MQQLLSMKFRERELSILLAKKQRNYNKGLVTKKYTVTKQTAFNLERLAAMNNCTEGMALDKIMRSLMATYHTKNL